MQFARPRARRTTESMHQPTHAATIRPTHPMGVASMWAFGTPRQQAPIEASEYGSPQGQPEARATSEPPTRPRTSTDRAAKEGHNRANHPAPTLLRPLSTITTIHRPRGDAGRPSLKARTRGASEEVRRATTTGRHFFALAYTPPAWTFTRAHLADPSLPVRPIAPPRDPQEQEAGWRPEPQRAGGPPGAVTRSNRSEHTAGGDTQASVIAD